MAATTQEERDSNESRNIRVVNAFKNHWFNLSTDLRNPGGGLQFKAQINYSSKVRSTVEHTDVKISLSGFGTDGAIEIYEAGDLTNEEYHLGIAPAFGKYKLEKSTGELVFTNTSSKMGGNFTVRILPLVG